MSSKQALLAGCVDYAGTFPPAALPLEGALARAGTFRAEARHPWLLSKVALPASQLLALDASTLFSYAPQGEPWVFTALGLANNPSEVAVELQNLKAWNQIGEVAPIRHLAVSYESKLFLEEFDAAILDALASPLNQSGLYPYFEIGFEGDWEHRLHGLCKSLAKASFLRAGIKVRTGGERRPSVEMLSTCVQACATYRLRFKATQGLHHPITSENEFGFVNLFASLTLAVAANLKHSEIRSCLEDRRPEAFELGSDGFSWNGIQLKIAEMAAARAKHGGCFGSCSIDEPDQFLAEQFQEV
ncbi:MAG: hypothetical protein KDD51_04100 [Bdellovibrionales bacterium]|nr:hypothetical protein [Bdellovibrionales bacterium]